MPASKKKARSKTASTPKSTGNAIATTDAELKNVAALWEGEQETGFEDTTSDDYALPFLKLLQKNSPEVDEDSGSAVDGAKAGMYFDTGTGDLVEEAEVIPCHYHRAMVEWRDRDEGGGFVAQHPPGTEEGLERDKSGRFLLDNGNYLADTRYFFCLRLTPDGDTLPVVVSFTSTQIKKARNWLTKMQNMKATAPGGRRYTLPMFANVYRLTSVAESNDQGSWKGYKVELVGPIQDAALAQAAKDARDMFKNSAERVKPPEEGSGASASEGGAEGDDIPF